MASCARGLSLMRVNVDVDHELRAIDDRFREQLKEYSHLPGVGDLLVGLGYAAPEAGVPGASAGVQTHSALDPAAAVAAPTVSAFARIADLCGQLRFQKRWSQTPRTPETSVMGHMFVVACYAYLLSMSLNACPTRRVNNFFTGLFHDLPELLTRDIISPVKKSFEGLDRFIREYEEEELSRRIFRPLDADGHKDVTARLGYYLGLSVGSEFKECVVEDGQVREVSFEELQNTYNHDRFDPKDGEAVKICDTLAAYIEAYTAMRNGITSDHIQQAFWRMREQNAKRRLGDVHIGALFTDFD